MTTIDNTAAVIEWRDEAGDAWSLPIAKRNTPVSMAGWTWEAKVYASPNPGAAVVATMTADTSAASSGVVTFTAAAADTAEIAGGTYWYRIRRTDTDKTMFKGPLIIPVEEP